MSNIEVGEYIRTDKGTIAKIEDIEWDIIYRIANMKPRYKHWITKEQCYTEEIIKHSKNIIDLIEVGDYINGCLIVQINKDSFVKNQINLWTNMTFSGKPLHTDYFIAKITANEIKSIVTKEQFKEMEYRINE